MSARLRRLAERLRAELPELDRETQRALRSWQAAQTETNIDAYIDSVALNLHGLYTGIERLLSQIAEQLDERAVEGETWHRALLQQMAAPSRKCARPCCGLRPQLDWMNCASSATLCATSTRPA